LKIGCVEYSFHGLTVDKCLLKCKKDDSIVIFLFNILIKILNNNIMKNLKLVALSLFVTVCGFSVQAQQTKTVVENAIASKDHTTLVAAVTAAGLVETLSGKGPFTVFAPTNAAFSKLPAGTVETLLKPENKAMLQAVLTYHVVAGNLDSKAVVAAIAKGNGSATVTTVQGGKLKASLSGKNVILTDEKGNKSTIVAVDIKSSNGVIHVVDSVVLPK
jgi:uncharacterized surface protein with fasciclin (FAS1) repeats